MMFGGSHSVTANINNNFQTNRRSLSLLPIWIQLLLCLFCKLFALFFFWRSSHRNNFIYGLILQAHVNCEMLDSEFWKWKTTKLSKMILFEQRKKYEQTKGFPMNPPSDELINLKCSHKIFIPIDASTKQLRRKHCSTMNITTKIECTTVRLESNRCNAQMEKLCANRCACRKACQTNR